MTSPIKDPIMNSQEVSVKPLEWREDDDPDWWIAEIDGFGFGYEVRIIRQGKVRVRFGSEGWQFFDGTADEAKAAAQADFTSRVLSALVSRGGPA